MHCLIVDTQADRLDDSMIAFLNAGVQVTGTSSLPVAKACLRRNEIDVLLIDHCLRNPKHLELVRMAEQRNPDLVTLLVSSNVMRDFETQTLAFSSIQSVLGEDVDPCLMVKMALGSAARHHIAPARRMTPTPAPVAQMSAPVFQSARAMAHAA